MLARSGQILTVLLLVTVIGPAGASPVGPNPTGTAPVDPAAQLAARRATLARLKSAVTDAGFDHARVGIHVVSLEGGEEIYALEPDALLNPASNMKVVTAAAALELLGPEFRFETEVYADAEPDADGIIKGNLYVKGKGDPTFVSERMFRLVTDLWHQGVRKVTGSIVIDDSYFDATREGPGWEQEESDRAYIAPTGAVSLNFNAVAIHVRPAPRAGETAVVSVDPDSDFFVIENKVITGPAGSRRRHIPESIGAGARQRIRVRGRQPVDRDGAVYYRRIDNPPLYFGHTFHQYLRRRGVRVAKRRIVLGGVPSRAVLLRRSYSDRLANIVTTMNKVSQNHIAEQLVKTLGAEIIGAPGSWPKGVAAVERYLETEVGIPRGSFVMKNGSGLNDTNRFSPRQLTRVLEHTWEHFQVAPEFVASLAVAGRDGTTRYRLDGTPAEGIVRAKTGTLENVSALSGYAATATGEVVAFAVLVNDHPGSYSQVVAGIDEVVTAIASHGLPPGMSLPEPGSIADRVMPTDTDQDARVTTYLTLGRAHDARNVPFLRTALRTERDPLMRAVVAEAIFLSDPTNGSRVLLDNFDPTPELIGRLRGLGHHAEPPATPVLTSVADLAAEGEPQAMRQLLRVVGIAAADTGLSEELADTLVEVGRTAPVELTEALLALDESAAGQVVDAFTQGLKASPNRRHPLLRELETQREADDDTERLERLTVLSERIETLLAEPEESRVSAEEAATRTADAEAPTPDGPDGPAKGGGSL